MSTAAPAKRFPWVLYVIGLVCILVFALWPIALVSIAGTIAEQNDCRAGSANPCLIGGMDWGPMLYGMGDMVWFMLATLPVGAVALAVWALLLVVHIVRAVRSRGSAP